MYVFLLFPRSAGELQKDYRLERRAAMEAYGAVVKLKFAKVRYVIVIATEPGRPGRNRSEDLMSFDFEAWTAEDNENAKMIQRELHTLEDFEERRVLDPPLTRRGDLAGGNRRERRRARALSRLNN